MTDLLFSYQITHGKSLPDTKCGPFSKRLRLRHLSEAFYMYLLIAHVNMLTILSMYRNKHHVKSNMQDIILTHAKVRITRNHTDRVAHTRNQIIP